MGTGGSSCSPSRRWRRPRWGSGSGGAPARPMPEEEPARAGGARPAPVRALPLQPPPRGKPDPDAELLDQALAECDSAWPAWLPAAPWHPSGTPATGEQSGAAPRDGQILLTRATPALENGNVANNLPLKKADRKSNTTYDYSEEEIMAAIEREYNR